MTVARRVQLEALSGKSRPSEVRLDRLTLAQLIEILRGIVEDDGDARRWLDEIREVHQELVDLGLGAESR